MVFNGLGHYLPQQTIPNEQLEQSFGLPAGWIESRTGIQSRHYAHASESLIDIAEKASLLALHNSTVNKKDIGMVLLATSTPDHLLPPSAPLLAHRLDLNQCGAFDLAGACCGFLYALMMADSYVRCHDQSVLIVAANILSRRLNPEEPGSAVLFGDGAGALIISPSTTTVLHSHFITDGSAYSLIKVNSGGSMDPYTSDTKLADTKISLQNGKEVFKKAIQLMTTASMKVMTAANEQVEDLTYFIPHQSNLRMMSQVTYQLGIRETKMISSLVSVGNTSAASIPISLSIANEKCKFHHGDRILLTAAGAGMTGGAIMLAPCESKLGSKAIRIFQ